MDENNNDDTSTNNQCYFCKDPITTSTIFSFSCTHRICSRCIIQQIFCHHINKINHISSLQLCCKCDHSPIGVLSLDLKQINDQFLHYKRTNNPLTTTCPTHDTYTTYYCKDCHYLICPKCFLKEDGLHHGHRTEINSSLAKKIKAFLSNTTMSIIPIEAFEAKYEEFNSKLGDVISEKFSMAMKNIESLIRTLQDIQNKYEEDYMQLLEVGAFNLKLVRMFYLQFYSDLEESKDSEDVNLLRYLNNISYEFFDININHDHSFDQIINNLQVKVEDLRKVTKPLVINFNYKEVARGFRCVNVIKNAHQKFIKTIIQRNDETIITGADDAMIKLWKDNDGEYKNLAVISKLTGNINALLDIGNGRLLSSSNDVNIKVWIENSNSYTIQQSFSKHSNAVTSLIKFKGERIFSGSKDSTMVIWKETDGSWESEGMIAQEHGPIYGLLLLNNGKLIIQTDYTLQLYNESEEGSNQFLLEKTFEMEKANQRPRIKAICELNDGRIACAGGTSVIFIIKKDEMTIEQVLCEHSSEINSVILLRDGKFASASKDHKIIIWRLKPNSTQYEKDDELVEYHHGLYSLIELKDGQLCASCSFNSLVFWKNRDDFY